ncbi:MAG: polymer-forming cytoskeletal protein [Paraburkholderia sp.]|nr:MAG: polymer-forming cytoskeletal protein [Paraburkholderia sp.]
MDAILFTFLGLGLLVLPFVPLAIELRASRDVAPLAIDEDEPIDASRLTATASDVTYIPHIDVDRTIFRDNVAASDIRVGTACRFQRLYGMPIIFGASRQVRPERDLRQLHSASMTELLAEVRHRMGHARCLVFGDLRLPANTLVEADLVIKGSLQIGESSFVRGDIKARSIEVCAGATVCGSVFAEREIRLGADSAVEGVLSVDGPLWIERSWIGSAANAVSVSASEIGIRGGACVYGQMIATRRGRFDKAIDARDAIGVDVVGGGK